MITINTYNNFTNSQNNTSSVNEPPKKVKSLFEKEEEIITGSYDFKYVINNNNSKIVYKGSYNNKDVNGKYTDDVKSYDYIIKNQNVYIIKNDKKVPYKDLYENLDYRLFDLENVFKSIKEKTYIKKIKDNVNIYSYDYLDYTLNIEADDNNILKIIYYNEKTNYTLNFIRK